MIHSTCDICETNPADMPRRVCLNARDDLRQKLRAIPIWRDAMLLPPVRGKSGMPQGQNHARPEVMSPKAQELRYEILHVLLGWASLHYENNPGVIPVLGILEKRRDDSLRDLVLYLERAEDWFLAQDGAAHYVQSIIKLSNQAERVAAPGRRKSDTVLVYHSSDTCSGGNVRVHRRAKVVEAIGNSVLALSQVLMESTGKCETCGDVLTLSQWKALYPDDENDLLTDDQLVLEASRIRPDLKINGAKVRRLRFKGLLEPAPVKRYNKVVTPRRSMENYLAAQADVQIRT